MKDQALEDPKVHTAFARDLLLTGCVCLALVCVAEAALHICGAKFDASLFQMDSERSYSFRPNATGWHTAESDIFVHINAEGNRDRLRSLDPQPGMLRIAVLGSSTTAALEVEQDQTYTSLLEHNLSRPGAPVEVMNFAVDGYGSAQDYYTLRDHVWQYNPQIVIDEVSLKQYVLNSTKKYSTTALQYPYFCVAGDHVVPDEASEKIPRPTPAQVSRSNRIRSAVNSIDLLLLLTEVKKQLGVDFNSFKGIGKTLASSDDPLKDPWRWTLIPPNSPEMEQGWDVVEGLTLAMRDEAAAHRAEFWVIMSDDAFQINPDPKVVQMLRQRMHADNLDYGDQRYDSFLTDHKVNHIHLEPQLLAYVRKTGAYLHGGPKMRPGEGHWNVLGHMVVARLVAQDLEQASPRLKQWEQSNRIADQAPQRQDLTAAQKDR